MRTGNKGAGLAVLLAVLAVMLSGCGGDDDTGYETYEEEEDAAQAEPLPATSTSAPRYPFPQHVTYAPGTVKPNHVSQAEMDQAVQAFYDIWKQVRIRRDCGEGRAYVFTSEATGGDSDSISVSEGHGYGMIITVLMAGYDPQAQATFDGLYRFFKDHPSVYSPYLMAWNQVEGCESIDGEDTDSATDGDMDIAYALLLADRQWGSDGVINYREEALHVMDAILAHEVNPETSTLTLGDWVTPDEDDYYYATRTSDFMPGHLKAFHRASGDDTWLEVLDVTYGLVGAMQADYSPDTGLLPDFIEGLNAAPQPAGSGFLEADTDGWYSYNACRDPWRIGVDVLLSGDPRGVSALSPMNAWVRAASDGDPAMIYAGYALDGSSSADYEYVDLAFIAPFGVGAMAEAENQQWVNDVWDFLVDHPPEEEVYFDSTLKLMSMLAMSGNWWEP